MAERGKAQILPFTAPAREDGGIEAQSPGQQSDFAEQLRIIEALVFASAEPVSERALAERLPEGADLGILMTELKSNQPLCFLFYMISKHLFLL